MRGWQGIRAGFPGSSLIERRPQPGSRTGGRAWRLYTVPFAAPSGATVWFRAQRLGYQESGDVEVVG